MKIRLSLTLLLLTTLWGLPLRAEDAKSPQWTAGTSSTVITPKALMWMAGYAARTKPAEGVDMDLFAKSLVLQDGEGGRIAIVTADLISIPRNIRLATAKMVEERFGIPSEQLLINVSHTHCGPEMRYRSSKNFDDHELRKREAEEYSDFLAESFTRIVGEALEKQVEVAAEYVHARCGFAMNRRTPDGKGGFRNAPNPDGPVDHRVPVLHVKSLADQSSLALLFGYASHCTTMGYQKYSGDYAGAAQEAIQKMHPGATALFLNGCSGDQNPYPRREIEYMENHGRSLALAVESALQTVPRPITGRIQIAMKEIPLAFDTHPTREELEEQVNSKVRLDAMHAKNLLAELDAGREFLKDYPYPVQVIRFGSELTLVALGGETVVDYSLRLQKEIKDPVVWVAGYSNDVMTYIPSRRVWEEGGYEGGGAMKWGTFPNRWHPDLEEKIVSAVHELRSELE